MKDGFVLSVIWALCVLPQSSWAFGFDDLAILEQSEQSELLHQATQAAQNNRFSKARQLIQQAEQKAYAPNAIQTTRKQVARLEAAYDQRQAEQRRQAQARQAAQAQQTSSSSSQTGASFIRSYSNASTGTEYVYKCHSGGQISVFVKENNISVFGAGTLSTTTYRDTVQSAAKKACAR